MNERLQKLTEAAHRLQEQMQDGSLVRGVLLSHPDDIMQQQHIQLLEGKGSDGNDLRPYYTEDLQPQGYFKSVQTASNYMAWKEGLTYPYSATRNRNAPNLYINGRFFNEMQVVLGTDDVAVLPKTSYAAGIMHKYGLQRFGLSSDKWAVLMNEGGIKNEIQQKIKDLLYGN